VFLTNTPPHNKVMVIDEGDASVWSSPGVTTNFRGSNRNAENLVLLRGGPRIARAYAENWRRHRAHSRALWRE
jgi:hypothetical protein